MLFYVTFEVSESMFEVSGPKSGWYDHQSSQSLSTKSTKLCCLVQKNVAPAVVWEITSMHLRMFGKQNRCTWRFLRKKSMHLGMFGKQNRCTRGVWETGDDAEIKNQCSFPRMLHRFCFPNIPRWRPDRIGHPHVGASRPPQPHCGARGGPAACLVGHQSDMVSLRLVQVCFKVYWRLFRVGFRFLQVSSWFVLGSI